MSTPSSSSTAHAPRPRPAYHLLLIVALLGTLALLMPPPALAAGIVVTTNIDTGGPGCSLRDAITAATTNTASGGCTAGSSTGTDTITFASNYTITLASTLPTLTSNLTIDGTGHSITISGNDVVQVVLIGSSGVVTLTNVSIRNGRNSASGGGAIANGGMLTVTNSTFSGNSARFAGAIDNSGTLTVTNSIFSDNRTNNTVRGGGGINNSGTLTVTNSIFSATLGYYGGAIENGSTLTVSSSTFSGNSAAQFGGAIANGGTLTITNSTFSGNPARFGGGIDNVGTLTVSSSTFSGNSATQLGGGIDNGGTLHLHNSLLANSPSGGDCSNSGTIATNLANLIADGSCSPAMSGDPLLSPLGNYGGATQTFALLPGSPVIDAGDSTACAQPLLNNQDQRGLARTVGASCDIGAFESRGFSLGSLSGTPQSTLITRAFATALGLTVSSASGEPVGPGGRVILTAPASGASITASSPITHTTTATGVVSQTVTANGLAGSYSVTASSRGAASPVSFSLTNVSSQAAIRSSANPSLLGQSVTFTATITGITTPTGQVGFVIDGGAPISVTLIGAQASFTTSSLAVGSHSVVANYGGDSSHTPSSATLAGGQRVLRRLYLPLIINSTTHSVHVWRIVAQSSAEHPQAARITDSSLVDAAGSAVTRPQPFRSPVAIRLTCAPCSTAS
jgi:hypothetical protein